TFHKIVAPHHGQHMPAAHVHGQQCTLHQRLLIQSQDMEFPCWVDLGYAHLNHIATPEQLSTQVSTEFWVYLPDPGISRWGYHPTRIFDRHRRGSIPYRQHHTCEPFAFAHRRLTILWLGRRRHEGGIGRAIPGESQATQGALVDAVAFVEGHQVLFQRLFGKLLQTHIECGRDRKATTVEGVWAVLLFQILAHVLHKIEGFVHAWRRWVQDDGVFLGFLRLRWR